MAQGQIRIIGGVWRGRKIAVPDLPDLRPTPDRVRETLFNWLQPIIAGAICLDLFAGSGALGLEALSRGAAHVDFVDQSPQVVAHLQRALAGLNATNATVYAATVPQQLRASARPFDVVFLDPPFQQALLEPCCQLLETHNLLAADATIYLEAKEPVRAAQLPAHWELLKAKQAGQVYYHLARRHIPA